MKTTPTGIRGRALAVLLLALTALAPLAQSARADSADPEFAFYASQEKEGKKHAPYPSPGGFEGPCGFAVDPLGGLYVSDYYRDDVDAFSPNLKTLAQLTDEDPLDGPCGLAAGPNGALYVNNYHRNVVKFTPSPFPFGQTSVFGTGTTIDSGESTGVAVDPLGANVYVDDRTYVAVYEPSGAPVEVGGEALRIGLGSLEEGYGVAVSGFSTTEGYVYAPDAASDTIKVYDPAVDAEDPIEVIDGQDTPKGRFVSLRDAAITVDRKSGRIFVADDLQPEFQERPEAAIYVFEATGVYAGRLKYNVIDARPPGLAVDNSFQDTQGRVYVTSGNGEDASVCGYVPGAITVSALPAPCEVPQVEGAALTGTLSAMAAASSAGVGGPAVDASSLRARHRHRRHPRRRHHLHQSARNGRR